MKKVLGIIAMAIMVSVGRVYADEGMWLPMFVERWASAAMPCRAASSARVRL